MRIEECCIISTCVFLMASMHFLAPTVPGTFHEETSVLAQKVTYLVCSQDYARQFSNIEVSIQDENSWRQTFDALHALNAGYIVVTLGDQGLLYEDTQGIHHIEAFNVSAVDTTGAGFSFS